MTQWLRVYEIHGCAYFAFRGVTLKTFVKRPSCFCSTPDQTFPIVIRNLWTSRLASLCTVAAVANFSNCCWQNDCPTNVKWSSNLDLNAWASEGFFPGGVGSRGFSQNFSRGAKSGKFGFYPSKLKKQTFLLTISKSRGALPPLPPLPTSMPKRVSSWKQCFVSTPFDRNTSGNEQECVVIEMHGSVFNSGVLQIVLSSSAMRL